MRAAIKSFNGYCESLAIRLREAPVIQMGSWQSTTANPHALRMRELLHESFEYDIPMELDELRINVVPFLPWADKHFEQERVSGMPINPGETFKEWRYPASASQHVDGFQFSHSYAERYWPTYAGKFEGGYPPGVGRLPDPNRGIRHAYSGLDSLLMLLANDHTTRQAYLPIFFPEDLMAARKKERIPCSLGYHFICRDGMLDVVYPMRSCDFVRHFRDDVYLTCRLVVWILGKMHEMAHSGRAQREWLNVVPGRLIMHITSLHCFEGDQV